MTAQHELQRLMQSFATGRWDVASMVMRLQKLHLTPALTTATLNRYGFYTTEQVLYNLSQGIINHRITRISDVMQRMHGAVDQEWHYVTHHQIQDVQITGAVDADTGLTQVQPSAAAAQALCNLIKTEYLKEK